MFFTDRAFLIRLFPQAAQLRLIEFCLCALEHSNFSLAGSQFFLLPWERAKYLKRSGTEPRTLCSATIRSNHWTMASQAMIFVAIGHRARAGHQNVHLWDRLFAKYRFINLPFSYRWIFNLSTSINLFPNVDLSFGPKLFSLLRPFSREAKIKLRRDSNLGLSHRA